MRGDLHLHSVYSDGSATVIELIEQGADPYRHYRP